LADHLSLQVKCSTYLRIADHAQTEQELPRRRGPWIGACKRVKKL
jgi:hypothetical protein